MLPFSLAFLSGVLVLQFFSSLPSNIWTIAALGASILLYRQKSLAKPLRLFLWSSFLGFAWCLFYANAIASFSLSSEEEGKPLTLQGKIISLPQVSVHQSSFLFRLSAIQEKPVSTIIRLSWRHPPSPLRVGEEWQFKARLKKIHSTMNPGGFDYEAWAFQNGIRASGYVLDKEVSKRLGVSSTALVNRLRQSIQTKTKEILPETRTAPWLLALMIGERNGIPPSEWEVLRNTGTNHLMAIAGLHIGFMSGLAYFIVSWLWRLAPRLMLFMPAKQAGACAALILSILYSALAGFSIPTQRASIMISIYLITTLKRRIIPDWQAWSLALFLVLLLNPLSVLSSSFWLSFVTIALILYGMGGRLATRGVWWKWGRPQWVIALGLLPLSIWLFTQYSLVSFIANTIAIPWVGFFILPLCFLVMLLLPLSLPLAKLVLLMADKSLSTLWLILTGLSQLSCAIWQQSIPHYGYLITAFVGVVLLLAPIGFPGRYWGFFWLLPLLFFKPPPPSWGEARFSLLDVGQGLSAVVQTERHALVFDAGARFSAEHDMGEAVVLPFLASQGIKQLDLLVVSHGDNDHSGGAEAILHKMPVLGLRSSVPQLFPSWEATYCLMGESWDWDGVHFRFLNPSHEQLGRGNNSSCVLQVSTKTGRILLPGDIEQEAEKYLLENSRDDLSADIIVAPHHGSKTSGLFEFIARVHPQYVLYATGYRNRYHFPHEAVIKNYRALGAVQWDTVRTGAIQITVGKGSLLFPELYRIRNKRYWHD